MKISRAESVIKRLKKCTQHRNHFDKLETLGKAIWANLCSIRCLICKTQSQILHAQEIVIFTFCFGFGCFKSLFLLVWDVIKGVLSPWTMVVSSLIILGLRHYNTSLKNVTFRFGILNETSRVERVSPFLLQDCSMGLVHPWVLFLKLLDNLFNFSSLSSNSFVVLGFLFGA